MNGLCVLKEDGTTTCQCPDPKACPAEFSRVCATNDKTYNNTCHMEVDECRKNKIIGIAKRGSCGKLLYIVHIVFSFLNHFLRDIQIRLPLPLK